MTTSPPRKRDGDQRRRELCDAGIQVLAEHGVPTPICTRLVDLIHEIEDGRRPLSRENLDDLRAQLPGVTA